MSMTVLSPEQRQDLYHSGLASISALGLQAVRPHDLPVKGAQSAYSIPYYDLSGKPNGFARLKLLPEVTNGSGHAMKYYQEPGTSPHLYAPRIVDWRPIATDATVTLTITEGEKKAACACQRGLITVVVAGVWNWTSTTNNGTRLTLPMFDQFKWTDRPVRMCPDSDAWLDSEKGTQILRGFFALAKDLQQWGAVVEFVVLPDLHGVKSELDDWLLVPGHDVEHSWPKLKRLPLDAARFDPLTAWWQSWRTKQATVAAVTAHDQEQMTVDEISGLYTVHSSTHSVKLVFDRLQEQRGSIHAEVTVSLGTGVLLDAVDLGLKSDTGQTKLAGSLKPFAVSIPWKLLLQRACALVLKRYREGEPLRILNVETPVDPLTYSINPLVLRHKPTVLFGDGGLGKSSLALFCAMLVSTGQSAAGLSALPGVPLLLDYEDSYDVHVRRMQAIAACHPELKRAEVRYQACTEPLITLRHTLFRRIQTEHITFLVLDSLAAATGGDASAEAANRVFGAIRTLGIETMVIAHIAKTTSEGQEPSIYGSVFNKNLARSTWEMRKEQEIGSDQSILGLFNRKANLSRPYPPLGFKVTQTADSSSMSYEAYDLSQAAELAHSLPLPNRVRNLLEDGTSRTARQIADDLGAKLTSVKSVLSREAGRKWMMLGGSGQETQWTVLVSK